MERYMNKKYRLVDSQNYDAYLKATGVKLFYRKLEDIVRQTIRLSEKDGKYLFETFWPMTTSSAMFRPGVPFDELRMDGLTCKSLIEFKDNRMVHRQMARDVETTIVREFTDRQVTVTITCGAIVCSRVYARVYEK